MTEFPFTNKHCYALINPKNNSIIRVTGELDSPPPNEPPYYWQEVTDDAPGIAPHAAQDFERHSPRFEMIGGRVHRVFQIRRKK